jgi:hypothetical protein
MAIAATVIGDGDPMSAAQALIEMTAESGGPTTPNGPQYFDVLPREPMAVSFDERLSCRADDVGHLQRRPAHLVLVRQLVVEC